MPAATCFGIAGDTPAATPGDLERQIGVEAAVPAATCLELRATRPPLHQGDLERQIGCRGGRAGRKVFWNCGRHARRYTSRPINFDDLPLIRPGVRGGNQPMPNWVVAHIVPFLCIALITPHDMIEKPGLPERRAPSRTSINEIARFKPLTHFAISKSGLPRTNKWT